jgi:hypothetical protein
VGGVGVASTAQQIESRLEAHVELLERESLDAGSRQFYCQGKVVEPIAEFADGRGFCLEMRLKGSSPLSEQRYRVRPSHRLEWVLVLTGETKALAARHNQSKVRACGQETTELRRRSNNLLKVVEQQEKPSLRYLLLKLVGRPNCVRDRR